jgi:hypothetical protein
MELQDIKEKKVPMEPLGRLVKKVTKAKKEIQDRTALLAQMAKTDRQEKTGKPEQLDLKGQRVKQANQAHLTHSLDLLESLDHLEKMEPLVLREKLGLKDHLAKTDLMVKKVKKANLVLKEPKEKRETKVEKAVMDFQVPPAMCVDRLGLSAHLEKMVRMAKMALPVKMEKTVLQAHQVGFF